jgi:hypothetical protein
MIFLSLYRNKNASTHNLIHPTFMLPAHFKTDINFAEITCKREYIKQILNSFIPSGAGVYLHGSNSASLNAFSNNTSIKNRGCLLPLSVLKREGVNVESGEHTAPQFTHSYEAFHKGVSAMYYAAGYEDLALDEVSHYASYNCTDGRYPIV